MHSRVEKKFLIKRSKLNLQSQGGFKKEKGRLKGIPIEVIIPINSTQPPACLWRNETFPCKLVITSTYALPHMLRGFLWWRLSHFSTLSGDLSIQWTIWMHLKKPFNPKQQKEHTSHISILKSSYELYKSSNIILQSTLMWLIPTKCSQTYI